MSRSKRVFDLFWAILGLALLSPLLAAVALLVKVQDGGPVFFRQWRVGWRGRPFRLWKFRTMRPDPAREGIMSLTVAGDARVTRVGRWLRQLKLDELPQLFNVVSGDMSLVGPRPEVPQYVARYTAAQQEVLDFVPGLTDAASIRYRNESEILARAGDPERAYVDRILPDKIRLSLEYAGQATLWTDFLIICTTLRHILPIPEGCALMRRSPCFLAFLAAMLAAPLGAASGQRAPTAAGNPVLSPGDALRVSVWRHPEFSGDFTVGGDSALVHPLYQTVKVGGASLAVAKARLRDLLAAYDQNVQLIVEPLWPVSVVGEVRLPSLYRFAPGTTVAQAVATAGGPTERGRLNRVHLLRRQGAMTLDLTRDYARARDISVASGDQIVVARRSDFSFVRDVIVPLTSITAAVAAVISVSKQ